jgi:hypothetical protein
MTSNQHGPYTWGYTHDTMVETKSRKPAKASQSHKLDLSPDWSLQLDSMKLELLVIVNQICHGESVPGSCTHRPSKHGRCRYRKSFEQYGGPW